MDINSKQIFVLNPETSQLATVSLDEMVGAVRKCLSASRSTLLQLSQHDVWRISELCMGDYPSVIRLS